MTTSCPFCGSDQIQHGGQNRGPLPEFIIPFRFDQNAAAVLASRWIKRQGPMIDSRFTANRLRKINGVYLPTILYNMEAHADYSASIGNKYVTGSGKNRKVKFEMFRLNGRYSRYLYNVFVSASQSISNQFLERIEPFDTTQLRPFQPQYLSGWAAENVTRNTEQIDSDAMQEFDSVIRKSVYAHLPGDKTFDLSVNPSFENVVRTLTLVPIWIFAVRMAADQEPIRIFVNGQTGAVTGKAPLSIVKLMSWIGGAILAMVLAYLFWGRR